MKLLDRYFSFVENRGTFDRAIFKFLALVFIVSAIVVLVRANEKLLVDTPRDGGELVEGVLGTPRFVNPTLALTGADRDLVSLIYSGIMRLQEDGTLAPDLAASLTISEDGLVYNITLRSNAKFHDGTPVTADDVITTIARIQDPAVKSPLRASWEGVTTERIDDRELNIVLPEPYAPFIENLTLGILPKHIWEPATADEFPFSQYNNDPIGSGPYQVERINLNTSGIPESYILTPYEDFYLEEPNIDTLRLNFYPNETRLYEALEQGAIQSTASLSEERLTQLAQNGIPHSVYTSPLPRTFALFFNQNEQPVFRDRSVRRALETALDRNALIASVLGGHALPITTPIPPGFGISVEEKVTPTSTLTGLEEAKDILRAGGWKINEENGLWEKKSGDSTIALTFSVATVNSPEFQDIAEYLKSSWESLGVVVDIKKFEQSDLTQTVIRPRTYEALLFGTEVGRELDLYSFWHSSQRNDPGLNVALYANITTDSILAEARTTNNFEDRESAYQRFVEEINAEVPAIFLFVPTFTYVLPPEIIGVSLTGVAHPSERFSSIREWYTETESVWNLFGNDEGASLEP